MKNDTQIDTFDWTLESLNLVVRQHIKLLQLAFSQFPEGTFKWVASGKDSPEDKQSELFISNEKSHIQTEVNRRPCILVRRQGFMSTDGVRNHKSFGRLGPYGNGYADLWSGTILLHCIAVKGLTANRLGWAVARLLKMFAPTLMKQSMIHQVGLGISISGEQDPNTEIPGIGVIDSVMVTVTSPIYLRDEWYIKEKDPKFIERLELVMGLVKK